MKMQIIKICLFGILPSWIIFFSVEYAHTRQGVIQIYQNANAPFDDEAKVESVLPVTKKSVPVKIKYRGSLFWTETRAEKIERYKCSRCHNNKKVTTARAAETAHGDIILNHGLQGKPLSCFTCHKDDERDFLMIETNLKVDMDHSYQLCGHCHFRQKKDWVGGAHGKRIAYWAGRRVVKNCTSCHNPHAPRFEKRWPETYSPPISK